MINTLAEIYDDFSRALPPWGKALMIVGIGVQALDGFITAALWITKAAVLLWQNW